jgi:hypothetical protein
MTHEKIYTPRRVPQGCGDAVIHFQKTMETCLVEVEKHDKSKTLEFDPIFKEVGSEIFDIFRMQAPLLEALSLLEELPVYKKLLDQTTELIEKFEMQWQPERWVALKSSPGDEEQDPPEAFQPSRSMKRTNTIQRQFKLGSSSA